MTASLAQSDIRRLRNLADSWRQARRSAWFADGLHVVLDAIEARRAEGGDVLAASVYGNSIPELREAALARARGLYGPRADLAVESIGTIGTSFSIRGQFHAQVDVRCVNFAAVALTFEGAAP
jgi:hypothetical protein